MTSKRKHDETTLLHLILRAFGTRSDMRLWRNNTGVASFRGRRVRFGVPGQADISGILKGGRRIEIECKSPDGRLSVEQEAFGLMIEKFGGLYVVARTLEDVEEALNENGNRD